MKKWIGYQKGVNLGGWLSQCVHTNEHYDTFITKEDVMQAATWGIDHLRLPIDYKLLQTEDGQMKEENFKYIDNCLNWCEAAGLNMILDVHSAAGYSFDADGGSGEAFFYKEDKILMFMELWNALAKRYAKYASRLAFELLNEVVEERDNKPWMAIAKKTVAMIREYSKDIKILIGSYRNNSFTTVKCIDEPYDENIVYNAHCYDPLLFTHQGAYWVDTMPADFRMRFPIDKESFVEQAKAVHEDYLSTTWAMEDGLIDERFFENLFAEAIRVAEERGAYLYCGEYGVIDRVDADSAMAWLRAIHKVFEKHNIGRAIWTYKAMDFGLTDARLDGVREELMQCL